MRIFNRVNPTILKVLEDSVIPAINERTTVVEKHFKALEDLLREMNRRLDDLTSSLIGIKEGEIGVQEEMRKFFKVEREIREREGKTEIEKPTEHDKMF